MSTVFTSIKNLIANNLLGSTALLALFVIGIIVVLILAARVSVKVALIIIFPAILALLGIGVSQGILGTNYKWIGILVMVAIGIAALAFIWNKVTE